MENDKAKDLEIASLRHEIQFLKQEIDFLRTNSMEAQSPTPMRGSECEEKDFKAAVDRMDVAIIHTSIDGDMLYANQKFCNENHIDFASFPNFKIYNALKSFGSKDEFDLMVRKMRENNGMYTHQKSQMLEGESKKRTFKVNTFISKEKDGSETIWILSQDISDVARSRDEFHELNNLLDAILSNIPVYLFVKDVDDDLRYLYWNKAFADHSKIPASRVIGKTDFEVFPVYEDAQKFRDDDMEVLKSNEPLERHETYEAADGNTRIVQTLKTLVPRKGRGPLLIGVSWDITNMQDIEQELVQERLRADKSDRLKSLFLANMSHEIRTPLNAIVGFSQLLIDAEDPENKKEFSEIIEQNSNMLLNLINDILDISKIEAGTLEYNPEKHDLREVFCHEYEILKNKPKDGVRLVFDDNYPGQPLYINEDQSRITQVLTNFINNAIKFTHHGSINFGYNVEDDRIVCYVRDTGMGIPANKLDAIFDRFVKLNKFEQGTGLGLSICKVIANAMGGKIWVESTEGEGSTFYFSIPYVMDRKYNVPIHSKEEAKPVEAISHNAEAKILVAEDVPSNFLLIRAMIGKKYKLLWAKDGLEAVSIWEEENPDLILMDVKMPEVDGLEATKRIRSTGSKVPIIALTAFAFPADKQKALDAGVNDYLTKPVDRKALESAIARFLSPS